MNYKLLYIAPNARFCEQNRSSEVAVSNLSYLCREKYSLDSQNNTLVKLEKCWSWIISPTVLPEKQINVIKIIGSINDEVGLYIGMYLVTLDRGTIS